VPLLKRELAQIGGDAQFFHRPLQAVLRDTQVETVDSAILSVFISSPVGPAQMDQLPGLELIATRSTGFDHIDLEEATRRGITVCNVPVYGDNTVAEHTFALILSLSRKLRETYEKVRRDEFNLVALEGFDLRGKTLGVIGTGHIGLRVIQIARGFSMKVIAFDPREQPLLADVLGFAYCPLSQVLARSDIVSLHAPLNRHTRGMINADTIEQMRPGALLVNTARGGLVDTDALVEALNRGHLGGAGLDVLEHESMLHDEDQARAGLQDSKTMRAILLNHLLLKKDNVIFTPHVAFNSKEANERILLTTVENIRAFLAGNPQNAVNQL
jgi:D-lactate dehydrogenase